MVTEVDRTGKIVSSAPLQDNYGRPDRFLFRDPYASLQYPVICEQYIQESILRSDQRRTGIELNNID
jgi:hypothetical protein